MGWSESHTCIIEMSTIIDFHSMPSANIHWIQFSLIFSSVLLGLGGLRPAKWRGRGLFSPGNGELFSPGHKLEREDGEFFLACLPHPHPTPQPVFPTTTPPQPSLRPIATNFIIFKICNMAGILLQCTVHNLTFSQGWEFAHRFSEQIARLLRKNERMSDSLKKQAICSFAQFWWATWANRSWFLIFGERPEQFAHNTHLIWAKWAITHIAHQKRGNERKWVNC